MKKINWIFLNKDHTIDRAVIEQEVMPNAGDGKSYNNKGYTVKIIGNNMTTYPDGLVIAEEHDN